MALLGLNSTKDFVYVALVEGPRSNFSIKHTDRLPFSSTDLSGLSQTFELLICARRPIAKIAVLRCFSGSRGSSVEAIKAEAVCELVAEKCGIPVSRITPQSLPAALDCPKGTKWQKRAKELFNSEPRMYFSSGLDGAISAAFKAS